MVNKDSDFDMLLNELLLLSLNSSTCMMVPQIQSHVYVRKLEIIEL